MKKPKGYIIFDETWNRLVRWSKADPCLWQAYPDILSGPLLTLFKTKAAANKAIRNTRKYEGGSNYAWQSNKYVIYEVEL